MWMSVLRGLITVMEMLHVTIHLEVSSVYATLATVAMEHWETARVTHIHTHRVDNIDVL